MSYDLSIKRDFFLFWWVSTESSWICSSDSFVQKTTQQSNGSCNATSDSKLLCKLSIKQLFNSANRYEKYFVSKEYCIAHHDAEMWFSPNCKLHILLISDVEELLQKLDPLCLTYQRVDCLYTPFRYRSSGNNVVKIGEVLDNLHKTVYFIRRNRGVDRMSSIAREISREKSIEIINWATSKRQNQRRPVDQSLQRALNKFKDKTRTGRNKNCWLFPRQLW